MLGTRFKRFPTSTVARRFQRRASRWTRSGPRFIEWATLRTRLTTTKRSRLRRWPAALACRTYLRKPGNKSPRKRSQKSRVTSVTLSSSTEEAGWRPRTCTLTKSELSTESVIIRTSSHKTRRFTHAQLARRSSTGRRSRTARALSNANERMASRQTMCNQEADGNNNKSLIEL